MQLQPGTNYTIVRQLEDPNDSTLYYPRAVVTFSQSAKVYKTVDLVQVAGTQRYIGNYITPVDGTNGVQIDITITVYTDAAHTIVAPNYAVTNSEYLVLTLFSPFLGFGGGSDSLSKEDIEVIVRKALGSQPPVFSMDEEAYSRIVEEQLQRNFENNFSTFHDSLTELHDKHDKLEAHLNLIDGKHENLKQDIGKFRNSHLTMMAQSSEDLKTHFQGAISDHLDGLRGEIMSEMERKQDMSAKELAKLDQAIRTELENKFTKLVKNKSKLKKKNMDDFVNNIRQNLSSMVSDNDDNFVDEEPEKIDFLSKAKALLS